MGAREAVRAAKQQLRLPDTARLAIRSTIEYADFTVYRLDYGDEHITVTENRLVRPATLRAEVTP